MNLLNQPTMKKLFFTLCFLLALAPCTSVLNAAEPPTRSDRERIEGLEAELNGGARGGNTNAPSKIAGPGPGHNGFQMVCAALVLFMTLPGLALFYGGLVRRKNVLSVLAQCLGIAGLVTILWWLCGYSLAFNGEAGPGFFKGIFGSMKWKLLDGVTSDPN